MLEQDPVPLRRLNPDIPRDLETICLKCLRKNPGQRYSHGAALVAELERYGRGEPLLARPVSSFEKAGLWCRRNPALAGAIGLSLGIAAAGALGILVQWRRAESLKNQAQDEAARARAFSTEASLQAYAADMRVISDAVRDGDLGVARDRLRAWIPRPGDVDRREFAWRYLSQEVQSESLGVVGKLDWIVTSVACSPDGSRLVVAGQTNGIQMFAIPEGRLLWRAPLRAGSHMDTVDALAFSPDGSQLASGGRDGKLFLWDTDSGKRIVELTGHRGTVNAVAWSPDGSTLATTEAPLGVRLFHVATRREVALLPIPNVLYWLRFSPDGRTLAVLLREPGSSLDQPAFRVRLLRAAEERTNRNLDE